MDDRDLIKGTAAWLARTPASEVTSELSVTDALSEVPEFLNRLVEGRLSASDFRPDDRAILILRVACNALAEPDASGLEKPLEVVRSLYEFVHDLAWPQPDFGERAELLADCAFAGWRISRKLEKPGEEARWLERFRMAPVSPSPLWFEVERVLGIPLEQCVETPLDLSLDDSKLLLAVCETLRTRNETSPADSKARAETLNSCLANFEPTIELCAEREYFLGDLALIAGSACRFLFLRKEARRWFDRAEASFIRTSNGPAHVARIGYQRLALAAEERRFEEVQELVPLLAESFDSMGLAEESLKCRFLEAVALKETGHFAESIELFKEINQQAEAQCNVRLIALSANSLAQYCRLAGDLEGSLNYAKKALPLLKQLDSRVHLVKLQWAVGNVLGEQGKLGEAIVAFREALEAAQALGLRNDAAELHLLLADVLLDVGQDRQAELEVRAALPIIDEERMVPEGLAALDLLRQTLRHRRIDRNALRELHGYFGDSQA